MEKDFLLYKQALELKELGFDEPCFYQYVRDFDNDGELIPIISETNRPILRDNNQVSLCSGGDCFAAPTYSQAFRWFEDNHQLYPAVVTDQTSYPKYAFEIASFFGNPKDLTEKEWGWNEMVLSRSLYRTKTEAELECLKKLIEIVKEKLE